MLIIIGLIASISVTMLLGYKYIDALQHIKQISLPIDKATIQSIDYIRLRMKRHENTTVSKKELVCMLINEAVTARIKKIEEEVGGPEQLKAEIILDRWDL